MHTQTCKIRSDAQSAVIFIHGFMGSPDQFAELSDAVYNIGCTYVSVLLLGHGASVREFAKFGARDWQRHLQTEIDKIKNDYQKIFIVGHSMGGLLGLNASLIRENKISGVMLISTPLKVYLLNGKSFLAKLRLLFFPKSNEIKAMYLKSNSIAKSKLFFYPLAIKPVMEFYKLMKQTKKNLSEVFVPVYMFHSKNDETTSYKSAALLYKGLCNTKRAAFSLDKSWHAFYDVAEREFIRSKLIKFIQQIGLCSE